MEVRLRKSCSSECCLAKKKNRLIVNLRSRANFTGMTDDEVSRACEGTLLLAITKLGIALEDLWGNIKKLF